MIKLFQKTKVHCYCAFCKNPRTVYKKRHLSLGNYVQALSLAVFASYMFWQSLDAKGILIFVIALVFIESFILMRHRLDVACPHCGFDALLYLKNQAAACEKVKIHLATRQSDPNVWLGRRPPLRFAKKSPSRKDGKSTREIVV